MFKHLLLPTDGSSPSEGVNRKALQFAKEQQARVTAIHVVPTFHTLTYRTTMLEGASEAMTDLGTTGSRTGSRRAFFRAAPMPDHLV